MTMLYLMPVPAVSSLAFPFLLLLPVPLLLLLSVRLQDPDTGHKALCPVSGMVLGLREDYRRS